MFKKDVVQYFGNQSRTAEALGITHQYVSLWPEIVPELWAWKIQGITDGKLKVDRSLYEEKAA